MLVMLRAAGLVIPYGSSLHRVYPCAAEPHLAGWTWGVRRPGGEWLGVVSRHRRRALLAAGIRVTAEDHGGRSWCVVSPAGQS